jgi:WD40 repeat protein
VSSLAYSYISDLLFLGCNDKIKVYAGSTGQSIKEINSPQQEDENIIISEIISFSINKQTYIACIIKNKISAEELICVYDYASNNYIKIKDLGFTNLKNLIYCNDSKTLIISSSQKENEALILFNFKYGSTKIFSCDGKSINSMIYIGEDDFVIVSGTNDSYLNIFSY